MTLLEEIRGVLAYLRTNEPVTAANLDTAVIPALERVERALDPGRSIALDDGDTPTSGFTLRYRGVLITLQPGEAIAARRPQKTGRINA